MKFCWVTINVADMDKSLEFYTKAVGLPIARQMQNGPDRRLSFLGDPASTQVELIYDPGRKEKSFGPDISIGFEVQSVDAKIEELKSLGVAIASGPHQPIPSIKFFYVSDPDGLKVQFVENIR